MPMPSVNSIAINIESGKIYRIRAIEGTRLKIERIGDGYAVELGLARFSEIYAPATPEQEAKIDQVTNLFTSRGVSMTVEALDQVVVPPDDGGASGSAPMSLGTPGPAIGDLISPDPEIHKLENMVLYPECVEAAMTGIQKVRCGPRLEARFNISKKQPKSGRCAINLYGPPGTGKTMMALGIALSMNKKLYKVDYSQMISKWVGDTGKAIKAAFAAATQHGAILFFDEADSMLSRRQTITDDAVSNSVNQNRNILMQELDNYNGIVFFTTNKYENYDEAIVRRIAEHVEFKLPNETMRKKLYETHFKHEHLKEIDYAKAAKLSKDFSGGDILNVTTNAENRCPVIYGDDETLWFVTQAMLEAEIKKVANAKKAHSGKGGGQAPMGLTLKQAGD